MKTKLKYVIEFYLTVGVPLLYMLGLYLATISGTLSIPSWLILISLAGVFIGLALWIISYATLSSSFGVLPKTQLRVKRGIYSLLRHPMYVGIILTYLGLSIANESKSGVIYTISVLLPILIIRGYLEEKKLKDV